MIHRRDERDQIATAAVRLHLNFDEVSSPDDGMRETRILIGAQLSPAVICRRDCTAVWYGIG
jgi:hypothetical protein